MKKLIFILIIIFAGLSAYGQLDTTNIGTGANTGTGESIRSAFMKVNDAIRQININTDSLELKLNKVDTLTLSNRIDAKLNATHESTYNHTNYNTAYTDRLKWDGGSTGLTAATGRTSLGGTTAGQAIFTLTNPSAITFLRINADNSVTALSAANFKTALSLTASDVGLGNVTNESKTTMFTNPTVTGIVKVSTTDTLATKQDARLYAAGATGTPFDSTYVHYRIDSLVTELNDTVSGSSVFVGINDIKPYYTFGAGTGAAADSTLFAKGNKSFGSFRIMEDSLYVESLTNLYMTSGDSLKFNVYYGNGMTRTATDSLFTAPQGAGAYAAQTFTPNNKRTINHGHDVWVGIIGPQPANKRPKEWILQLNAKIVRD